MSIKKLALRSGALLIPLFGAFYAAGCGGSAFSDATGGSAAGGAAGSAVSGAGGSARVCTGSCVQVACGPGEISMTEPGSCCPSCVPNGQGGAGASGGSVGVGGCSGVTACTAIGCGVGFTSVTKPGDCCPTCVPNGQGGAGGAGGAAGCGAVECPAYACVAGYKSEQLPGQCCPTCVPDSDACTNGQQGYGTLRQKLLAEPGVLACKVDTDCTTLPGSAYCGDPCAASPVNVTSAPGLGNQLSSYASSNCSTCTPTYPPCAAPLPPHCVNSVCADYAVSGG